MSYITNILYIGKFFVNVMKNTHILKLISYNNLIYTKKVYNTCAFTINGLV